MFGDDRKSGWSGNVKTGDGARTPAADAEPVKGGGMVIAVAAGLVSLGLAGLAFVMGAGFWLSMLLHIVLAPALALLIGACVLFRVRSRTPLLHPSVHTSPTRRSRQGARRV